MRVDSVYSELAPAYHASVTTLFIPELAVNALLYGLDGVNYRHPSLVLVTFG